MIDRIPFKHDFRTKIAHPCVILIAVLARRLHAVGAGRSARAPSRGPERVRLHSPSSTAIPPTPIPKPLRSPTCASSCAPRCLFNKQYGHYATSLDPTGSHRDLHPAHGQSRTRRLHRRLQGKKDNFVLTMTPKNLDAQHRSFYAENDGKIHADETKPADADSPVVETHHW